MNYTFVATIGRETFSISDDGREYAVVGGTRHSYSFTHIKADRYSLVLNGSCFEVIASMQENGRAADNREILISLNGKCRTVQVDDERTHRLKSLFSRSGTNTSDQVVRAPMPGLISRLEVAVGDEVVVGNGLLVLEAMKMENEIRATMKGKVVKIFVDKGKIVEKGESLVTISNE